MGWDNARLARERHRLSSIIGSTVRLKRVAGGFMGLCPFHTEKTPSFHVSDIRGTFKCFGCGAWGDVIDFVMLARGVGFTEALNHLLDEHSLHDFAPAKARTNTHDDDDRRRRIHHAHELWLKRAPITDTIAEDYLRKVRRISEPYPDILGFVPEAYCSPVGKPLPALIAPLQDSSGHVTAVQQIFLNPEWPHDCPHDERGRRIKRTLGVMADGAVRLGVPFEMLGLAGSVEDALAASRIFSLPVWATCGEARLGAVMLPHEIEHVVIFADADQAGHREAEKAAEKYGQSVSTEIRYPDLGKDWAEKLAMYPA